MDTQTTLRDLLIQAFYERSSPDTREPAELAADQFLETMDEGMKKAWYRAWHDLTSEHEWIVCYDAHHQTFYLRDLLEDEEDDEDI